MPHEDKIQELLIGQATIQQQLARIISDIESEKDVRKRIHDEILKRIRDLEDWKTTTETKIQGLDNVLKWVFRIVATVVAGVIMYFLVKK